MAAAASSLAAADATASFAVPEEGVAQLRIPHNIFMLMSIKSTLPYYVQHILDVSYDRSGF